MTKTIKTAEQHTADIIDMRTREKKQISKKKREQKQHDTAVDRERQRREAYEYMRDELMSAVKNSGMSFQDIHGACGPHPSTLEGYAIKRTIKPQMAKMQSTADIIGMKWSLVPK
jgi:hypothetical protein